MALATLTLTTNSKAIDFHRNDGEITGVEGGDEYLIVDKILRLSILTEGIIIKLVEDSEIFLPFDQVETVGADNYPAGFPDVDTLKTSLKTLLSL